MTAMIRPTVCLAVLCGLALPAAAQTVWLEGGEGVAEAGMIRELLNRDGYRVIDRDTVLGESFALDGDLVIVGAEVRMEGRVQGSVAVLGGDLFVRPAARIRGRAVALGGGLFPSNLAEIGEERPGPIGYRVEIDTLPGGYRVRVIAPELPSAIWFPGAFGFKLPTYDRVDGLTVRWGPELRLLSGQSLIVRPWISYKSARGALGGGARLESPLGSLRAEARVERVTETPDRWVRGDLVNSFAALVWGTDQRDYYESDRVVLSLWYPAGFTSPGGAVSVVPRLTLLGSRDRSLRTGSVWSLFGADEMDRFNRLVDRGSVLSLTPSAELFWFGGASTLYTELVLEWGVIEETGPASRDKLRRGFTHWTARADWEVNSVSDHKLFLWGYATGTFGEGPAPRQRWSFLGSSSTIPLRDIEERLLGDRLVLLRTRYEIPTRLFSLPILGPPTLRLLHVTGSAWRTGEPMPGWDQNVGAGIGFSLLYADLYVDPAADPLKARVLVGLSFPF